MQIRFYTHSEIDKSKWDICLTNSLNGMVYAYSWYLDVVAPGWCAIIINDYEAVFPLPVKRKLFRYVYQPFFTQQLGLFYTHPLAAEKINEVIQAIPTTYKYIDIQINEAYTTDDLKHGKTRSRKNYVVHLHPEYKKLHKEYSDHTRRNLKKAQRFAQQVTPCDSETVIALYRKHKGEETKNLDDSHYRMLKRLFDILWNQHLVKTLAVTDDAGQLLCSAAFAILPTRMYYLMGSVTPSGKEQRSMYLLFDYMIKQYSNQPMVFDFEGSEIPGVARMFKGFGATSQPYVHLRINRLPRLLRWLKG